MDRDRDNKPLHGSGGIRKAHLQRLMDLTGFLNALGELSNSMAGGSFKVLASFME